MNAHLVEFLDVKARWQCFLMVGGTSRATGSRGGEDGGGIQQLMVRGVFLCIIA